MEIKHVHDVWYGVRKDEIDFKQLEWEIYEDEPQQRPRFYLYTKTHLTCKEGITTKYSKVFLDGGLLL